VTVTVGVGLADGVGDGGRGVGEAVGVSVAVGGGVYVAVEVANGKALAAEFNVSVRAGLKASEAAWQARTRTTTLKPANSRKR